MSYKASSIDAAPESKTSAQRGRIRSAIEWGDDNTFLVWAWLVITMFILTCVSIPLGNFAVQFDGHLADGAVIEIGKAQAKEVGYLFAPNWAPYSIVVLPMMMVFCLRIWAEMPSTLRDISTAGMIRNSKFEPVDENALTAAWNKSYKQSSAVFIVIFVCTFAFMMWDWWSSVAVPVLNPHVLDSVTLTNPVLEFDWSIACVYQNVQIACGPLLAFGFVAYLLIAGIGTAVAFATCICALLYVTFVCGLAGNKRRGWILVAIPSRDGDRRCGFGNFSRFFTALLGLCIGIVVGSLLMIIQNNYLRDGNAKTVFDFIFGDANTMWTSVKDVALRDVIELGWLEWLFAPASVMLSNPDTGMGIVLFSLTAVVVVGMSWGLLRNAAQSARENSLTHAEALAKESGMTERTLNQHLKEMDFWPVGWLNLNQLIILMMGSVAAVMSYRLLLLPLAWIVIKGGHAVVHLWRGGEHGHEKHDRHTKKEKDED